MKNTITIYKVSISILFLLFTTLKLIAATSVPDTTANPHPFVIVPSFSFFTQTDHFDANGNIVKGYTGLKFNTYVANIHFDYTWTKKLNLMLDLPDIYQQSNLSNSTSFHKQGGGDAMVSVLYNLANFKNSSSLSAQFSTIIPLYNNNNAYTAFGLDEYGNELKLICSGILFKSFLPGSYYSTQVGFRLFYNSQGTNQWSAAATAGHYISKNDQISLTLSYFGSVGYSGDKIIPATFINGVYVERNYAFLRPGVNYSHQFTPKFSFIVGASYTPYGLNTGVSYSAFIAVSFKF